MGHVVAVHETVVAVHASGRDDRNRRDDPRDRQLPAPTQPTAWKLARVFAGGQPPMQGSSDQAAEDDDHRCPVPGRRSGVREARLVRDQRRVRGCTVVPRTSNR